MLKQLSSRILFQPPYKTGRDALKRLKISKKKNFEYPKACPLNRAKYLNKLNNYIAQDFVIVYINESDLEAETIRPNGYAPIGTLCIDWNPLHQLL